jgi:hypothetical protein
MKNACIITFHGTHSVLRAERLLKKQGIAAEAIPAPLFISTECGICIQLNPDDEIRARTILTSAAIEINEVYND